MMDKSSIGKGVIYLYIEAITMLLSGYVYWLILSKIIDPSAIGLSSTIIALATIVSSFASVGVTGGIQRYMANSIAENKLDHIQGIINSSFLITGLGILVSSISILLFRDSISSYFNIIFEYILLSIVLFIFLVFTALLRAIIIPSLKVKVITVASVISTIIKLSATITLVFLGFGVFGIIFGFLLYPLTSTVIFTLAIKKKFYKSMFSLHLFKSTKDIFIASLPFWLPAIITTVGSQLGTITVFLTMGSNNAGIYFIAFSIVTGIMAIIVVLSSIAYPTISALKDGKKRATWRLIKISLILTIPISNILIFYPTEILSLFGPSYTSGSSILQILLLTSLPTSISTGIGVLLYSYGRNRDFLLLGLITSIPRVLLYFVFVPSLGGNGAALSFLLGSICGAVLAILFAKNIKIKLYYKQILVLFFIPVVVAIPLKYFEFNSMASIIIILILSYLVFIVFRLIDSQDIEDIRKILPASLVRTVSSIWNGVVNRVKG
jgi:O-antigen/teichoic acid export membrane protein